MAKTFCFNSNFIYEKLNNQLTVFNTERSYLYTFNDTASFVYQLLKRHQTIDQVSKAMQRHYGLTKEKADKDLGLFLKELETKQILLDHPQNSKKDNRLNKGQKTQAKRPARQPKKITKSG